MMDIKQTTKKEGWDRGMDFNETYRKMFDELIKTNYKKKKLYLLILLIQLRNGSRISEAIRAIKEFKATDSNNVKILVSKKRDKKVYRDMVLPLELNKYINELGSLIDEETKNEDKLKRKITAYCLRVFGFNTHSLRYSFITYLSRDKKIEPQLISKITKHSDLRFIVKYTQEKAAEDVLKNI